MKRLIPILIIFLLFLACEDPLDEDAVRDIVEEEMPEAAPQPETPTEPEGPQEPQEPEEPVWTPEPWHIYILDAADTILSEYETSTLPDYYYMLQAVKQKVEIHNRDFEDIWHWVAGGTS